MEGSKKPTSSTIIIIGVVVITAIIFGGGGYLFQQKRVKSIQSELKLNLPKPPDFAGGEFNVQDEIKGWKVYKDTDLGYSIKYPSDWTLIGGHRGGISFLTPGQVAMYKKDAEEGGPGGPTQKGCELFSIRVSDKKAYNQEFASSLNFEGFYGVQDTTLNGMKARFYISKPVCERKVWAVQKDSKVFEISVMTTNDLFIGDVVSPDEYFSAMGLVNTFTFE